MLERIVVDKDVLRHRGLTFRVLRPLRYWKSDEPTDFLVALDKGDKRVTWLQGWDDLSYDYMREYERQLEEME